MTRDDIVRMAREAGATFDHMTWVERDLAPVFERFAALVTAAEREACAKDAKRYRWLKKTWTTTLLDGSVQMANPYGIRCKTMSEIDAVIDAVRGEKE